MIEKENIISEELTKDVLDNNKFVFKKSSGKRKVHDDSPENPLDYKLIDTVNWEISDSIGGHAYGYIEGDKAVIVGMRSAPLETKSEDQKNSFKRRGFFKGVLSTLKDNNIKTVAINIQSQDTRNAVKRLIDKHILKNPRNLTGLSVDEHPTTFDIEEGVSIDDDGNLEFNWIKDKPTDSMYLTTINQKYRNWYKRDLGGKALSIYSAFIFKNNKLLAKDNGITDLKNKKLINPFKNQIDDARRQIKDLNDPYVVENVIKMIDAALDEYEKKNPINSFSIILSPESSGKLNNLIADRIKLRLTNPNTFVLFNSLVKKAVKDVSLDLIKLNRETSPKTKPYVLGYYKTMLLNPERLYAVKQVSQKLRRYFINFLTWKNDDSILKAIYTIKEGKVLIVDDTFGEGSTAKDIARQLVALNPKYDLYAFALINDQPF